MGKFISVVLLLCIFNSLFAQDKRIRFGVKGGANLSELRVSDYDDNPPSPDIKSSLFAGLIVNIPLMDNGISFQPELIYNRQGSRMINQSDYFQFRKDLFRIKLNYVSLPLLIHWQSPTGLFVQTGPQFSYLLKARRVGPETYREELIEKMESHDFSWAGGVGFLSKTGLGVNIRYNHGFTNIIKPTTSNPNARMYNSVVKFEISYLLGN